jgi:hypothetical protein
MTRALQLTRMDRTRTPQRCEHSIGADTLPIVLCIPGLMEII